MLTPSLPTYRENAGKLCICISVPNFFWQPVSLELSLSLQGTSLVCYCVNMFVCTLHARAHICVNTRYALVVSYFSMLCVWVCTLMFEAHMQETVKKSLKPFFPFTPLNYRKPLESHTAVWSSPCTEVQDMHYTSQLCQAVLTFFFFLLDIRGEGG